MNYSNKLAELVNEIKDSVDKLKGLTSDLNKSIDIKEDKRENEKRESSTSQKIELLEKKITHLEGKLFMFFGDSISKHVDQAESHPLAKNNLIVRTIFEFLDLASLKNCRQVCKMWEEISRYMFAKQVKIQFDSYQKTLEQFSKDFPLNSVSCNNFVFGRLITSSLKSFTNFFSLNSESMTSLEISSINLMDEDGNVHSLNIDSVIGPRLRKLKLSGPYGFSSNTQLILSLEKLKSIEYLSLESCVVVVSEECPKIEPIEINLESISFSRENGDNIPDVRLNHFIDFHRCSKIRFDALHNFSNYGERTTFSFPPDIFLDSVDLMGVGYSWKLNNKPKIKNIRIASSELNVNFLSESVETLSFSTMAETNQQKIFLPHLKHLECSTGSVNLLNRLSIFSDCPNLVTVNLEALGGTLGCSLNWLPLSVKKVKLAGVKVVGDRFEGRLTSLHLLNYSLQSLDTALTKLTTDNLYVKLSPARRNRRLPSVPTNILLRILQLHLKTFAIGNIIWADHHNFRTSEFACLVDRRSECYLFENGNGKALPYKKLLELMESIP